MNIESEIERLEEIYEEYTFSKQKKKLIKLRSLSQNRYYIVKNIIIKMLVSCIRWQLLPIVLNLDLCLIRFGFGSVRFIELVVCVIGANVNG